MPRRDGEGSLVCGTYRILGRLGEGSMGKVFRALDEKLEREVALKILEPAEPDLPEFSKRFIREAKLLASLQHPGLATVFAFGEHQGQLYMALELVEGRTLQQLLAQKGPLGPRRASEIALQMLDALGACHARGIVHRDIKPANVMVMRRASKDHVKLVDFGLAKLNWSEALTDSKMIVGTPHYMAPEHIEGAAMDPRVDLYSVGIVLYELLSGRTPFTGATYEILKQHLTVPPQPLRELRSEIPAALDGVVLRALAKKPVDRFQDTTSFAASLRAVADGLAFADEPGSSEYPMPGEEPVEVIDRPTPRPDDAPTKHEPRPDFD